jgi:hypothetical protein
MPLRAHFAIAKHPGRKQSPINKKVFDRIKSLFNVRSWLRRIKYPPRNDIIFFFLSSFLLFSCSTNITPMTPQVVSVYSTYAAEPWLPPLYDCAGTSTVISRVDHPASAEIGLRVGEPEILTSPAYQIDSEDILIVTHRQSLVQNLTLEEARALFEGQGDPSVQVWVFSSEEDIQQVFDQSVMAGLSVAPSARLAMTPQQMSDTLVNEVNAVGILPRHWKAGDVREVFSVATVPVLAITPGEPQDVIKELIACLQK